MKRRVVMHTPEDTFYSKWLEPEDIEIPSMDAARYSMPSEYGGFYVFYEETIHKSVFEVQLQE